MADTKDAESFVKLGHTLADAAAAITLSYFRSDVAVEDKDDESPVTRADSETESALREIISAKFPGHGIIGEEFGSENPDAEFVWVLDPIDGTVSFINGVPLFTTIIGLLENGTPAFGVLDQRSRLAIGRGLAFLNRSSRVSRPGPMMISMRT